MVKKIVSYIAVAATVVGSSVLPSIADDSTAYKVKCFPYKVVGSSLSTVAGVPLGLTKGGVEGGMKTTKLVAGKLGDEDGGWQLVAGSVVGGPFGVVGGAAYGCVTGVCLTFTFNLYELQCKKVQDY